MHAGLNWTRRLQANVPANSLQLQEFHSRVLVIFAISDDFSWKGIVDNSR